MGGGSPGLKSRQLLITCGFSQSILWYLTILAFLSQYCPLYSIRVATECGTLTVIFSSSVKFSTSDTRKAVAVRAHKQGGHPFAIEFNCLER
jgi:hypothetical protein